MKKHLKLFLVAILCFTMVFSMSLPAFAWAPRGSSISSLNCSYKHRSSSTTTEVENAFDQATGDWNSAVSGVRFYHSNSSGNEVYAVNLVGSPERGAMNLFGESYEGTGDWAREYFKNFYAYINIAFSQGTNAYRSTANHELGHVLGLDHFPLTTIIMNGNRNVEVIYKPQSDDKQGVRDLWGL